MNSSLPQWKRNIYQRSVNIENNTVNLIMPTFYLFYKCSLPRKKQKEKSIAIAMLFV
jgi:hypothetical protein